MENEGIERIKNTRNRVFQATMSFGKNIPFSLRTDSNHVYRVTGESQIEDIIKSGYVRPPIGKSKGGHIGEVFWTQGSDKLFFYDKRPVLETSVDILRENGQIGAISLDELTSIWMFDEQQNKYFNNIQAIREQYYQMHSEQEKTPMENNENDIDNQSIIPEKKYNDDGTYTFEYITYLSTTPSGLNKDIYDQLMKENERIKSEDQITNSEKHM